MTDVDSIFGNNTDTQKLGLLNDRQRRELQELVTNSVLAMDHYPGAIAAAQHQLHLAEQVVENMTWDPATTWSERVQAELEEAIRQFRADITRIMDSHEGSVERNHTLAWRLRQRCERLKAEIGDPVVSQSSRTAYRSELKCLNNWYVSLREAAD